MASDDQYDWASFFIHFAFGAVVGVLIGVGVWWSFFTGMDGGSVSILVTGVVLGVTAGIFRDAFWEKAWWLPWW